MTAAAYSPAVLAQELPHLLWDTIRSWSSGSNEHQREEAAVYLLVEHGVWPAKLGEAGLLRVVGPNEECLGEESMGKSPAEEVWTYVEWDRVEELLGMEEPPVYATRSEWAVLGFASSLMTSVWSPLLGSVDEGNTKLMHATLAWARSGEEAAKAFLG